MNILTREEFIDRNLAVARAREIFIPHFTKNITLAFEMYQSVLATKDRPLKITTATAGSRPRTFMDEFNRLKCPNCDKDMAIRPVLEPPGPGNPEGYQTCWQCRNCDYCNFSTKTLLDWTYELEPSRPLVQRLSKDQRIEAFENTPWGSRKPCCGQTLQTKGDDHGN